MPKYDKSALADQVRQLGFLTVICLFFVLFALMGCQKTEIDETKAVELSKIYLESINSGEFVKIITNYDSPIVEEQYFDGSYTVYHFGEMHGEPKANDLKGKKVWKITYTTPYDNLLGPETVYLDKISGEIYGSDLRM